MSGFRNRLKKLVRGAVQRVAERLNGDYSAAAPDPSTMKAYERTDDPVEDVQFARAYIKPLSKDPGGRKEDR